MKPAIKWGLILGASICVWTLGVHALGLYTTRIAAGQRADVIATILPIGAIVMALRERRKQLGRGLKIYESLVTALVVGLVSVPLSATFLWWYHHYMNPQWVDYIVNWQRETMTAAGASADSIAKAEQTQRASATDRSQLVGAVVGTAVFSLVIGLVASLFFRKRPASALTR